MNKTQEHLHFEISDRLTQAISTRLYEPTPQVPLYRRLKVFSISPAISRINSGIAVAEIPYEPLKPGPKGSVIEVMNQGVGDDVWTKVDLEDPFILMEDGLEPSLSDPRFHQQMVYAIAMMTYYRFSTALGRDVAWSFPKADSNSSRTRLKLFPHGENSDNAWYDREKGSIFFGYYLAQRSTSVVKKDQGYVFTSISHDVIAHEMSHALLDGLRSNFMIPTHQDVLAFHEALADLVAFFQHFTFEAVVSVALGQYHGNLEAAEILTSIALEFGRGRENGNGQALRTLLDLPGEKVNETDIDTPKEILRYEKAGTAPHSLGRVLSRAIFDAYLVIYKRRTLRFIKLATGGSDVLPEGSLSPELKNELVSEAQKIAQQFLSICVRAIDYCPPVDVRFGDYLRALITADQDVVPDDKIGYREALVSAFGKRGIYGEGTTSMAENALTWNRPIGTIPALEKLSFGSMEFVGDPAKPLNAEEMHLQAIEIGKLVCDPSLAEEFGLVSPHDIQFNRERYSLPIVESVRTSRRAGPDRKVVFDTVAEVIQWRLVKLNDGNSVRFYGGCTIIFGPRGEIRFVITKHVKNEERLAEQIAYMTGDDGANLWETTNRQYRPISNIAQCMCRNETAIPTSKIS